MLYLGASLDAGTSTLQTSQSRALDPVNIQAHHNTIVPTITTTAISLNIRGFSSITMGTEQPIMLDLKSYDGELGNGLSGKLWHLNEGSCSIIMRLIGTRIAIKRPRDYIAIENIEIERRAYERLGKHPFILRYDGETTYVEQGKTESVLILEFIPFGSLDVLLGLPPGFEKQFEPEMKQLSEVNAYAK
jgi:hypothetical protein